ncbi:MAG TPA: thioredoxin family protein [Paraburkholderia sp.]
MEPHKIVSQQEWLAAHRAHVAEEKALTRARDALSSKRRELPWVKVDKTYTFDTPHGRRTLGELFDGRSQLIVYHFMMGPDWEQGCPGCSLISDHVDGALVHLAHRDVTYVAVSRAPLAKIEAFRQRMGWQFHWVSSNGSDFNYDYYVSFTPEQQREGKVFYNFETVDFECDELPGLSVFFKDEAGDIFHTYSAYGRGGEPLIGTYTYLDLTPKGRDEKRNMMEWLRHHDRYDDAQTPPHEVGQGCH